MIGQRFSPARRQEVLAAIFVALAIGGCSNSPQESTPSAVNLRTPVDVCKPEIRSIVHVVGQPGSIDAYEKTDIYAKVAGYIKKFNVDIGDTIKKDQLLCELFVPELIEQHRQRQARVALSKVEVDLAKKVLLAKQAALSAATANVAEAIATKNRSEADVVRWKSESTRDADLVTKNVISPQIAEESKKQYQSALAQRDLASAAILSAQANRDQADADKEKAAVDIQAAIAKVAVDQADEQEYAALVSYTRVIAPYDGIVVVRNANTGDFVEPATGDRGKPIYAVARTDIVRIFIRTPEMDAPYVGKGSRAKVRVQAFPSQELEGKVTRTAWALDVATRTLLTEIDLPNPDAKLQPGMYAYGSIVIEHPRSLAVPLGAVIQLGNQWCCYVVEDGKARLTKIRVGVNDGAWIELLKKETKPAPQVGLEGTWADFSGSESLVNGGLESISDGEEVSINPPAKASSPAGSQ